MTTYSDYFGVFTYADPLVYFKVENHESWLHREAAVKKDVFLNKFVCGLDKAIFQELPIFVPDILGADKSISENDNSPGSKPNSPQVMNGNALTLNPEEPQPEQAKSERMDEILADWTREKWSDLQIRMFDMARTHKWCVVQLYNAPPYWRVFTYREIVNIIYNDNDEPVSATVVWTKRLPRGAASKQHEETLNFIPTKESETIKEGEYVSQALFVNFGNDIDEVVEGTDIENKWSLDVFMRYIMLDIVNNSAKSSGFYWVTYGSQVDEEKKGQIMDLFEKASSGRGIGATENLIKNVQAMYMLNPDFPIEALDKFLKIFSGACDMPLLWFNGEKEVGSIFEETSGGMAQINKKKRDVFGHFKQYILKLVEMRWGIVCEDVFPNIEETEKGNENYYEDVVEPREGGKSQGSEQKDKSAAELKRIRLEKK